MVKRTARIRIYYPFFPYPPTEGSFQVAWDQARALVQLGAEVELVAWKDSASVVQAKKSKGWIDPYDAGIRLRLLETPGGSSPLNRLSRIGRSLFSSWSSGELFYYDPTLVRQLPTEPVDLAIYHYSFCSPWLLRSGPRGEARRVVMFHNIETQLHAERAARSSGLSRAFHRLNARKLRAHEAALAGAAAELWFVSPEDEKLFRSWGATAATRLIPPTYSDRLSQVRGASFRKRLEAAADDPVTIGFIGGLDFFPNEASALWLIRELAPELERRGFAGKLWIVGRKPSETLIKEAARFPFVQLPGFVEDIEDFWASLSFALVPDVVGSGVRTKLLEAIGSGVPTLSTSVSVGRLHPDLQSNPLLHVSDDPAEWASVICGTAPLQLRKGHLHPRLPSAMQGESIYRFLLDWELGSSQTGQTGKESRVR